MATPLNTILYWFQTGKTPTEEEFAASWSSFFHKSESIPLSSIEGLSALFHQTASLEAFNSHLNSSNAHENSLAKLDASNLSSENVQNWKNKLNVNQLPSNIATIDNSESGLTGNVYSKQYINDHYLQYTTNSGRRVITNNKDHENKTMYDAFIAGWNVLPNYIGKDESEKLYSSRYILQGTDILSDFKGNTEYRPEHPAHDSLIAYGSKLGKGFVDGTNYSLFGTGLYELNDIPIGDSITAFGNNIANAKGIYGNQNRTAIASNGFNLRQMMTNNVTIGNLIWAGDIHSSVITGYNVRNYRYIFNSLVMGGNIYDASGKYPGETHDSYLDNDVMLGFGFYKDPKRHPASHNLLIGSHEHYGNGSPDFNYRPLVEGNFKEKYFGIQGKSINHIQDELNKVPAENVNLSLVSSPPNSNASYDVKTKKLILKNSPAGNYRLFEGLTPGESYLFSINSNIGNTGTWGYKTGFIFDSGNDDSWVVNNHLTEITDNINNFFDISLEGTSITGEINVSLQHIKNNENQLSIYEVRDFNNGVTFELRTANSNDNHIAFGKNSASKYAVGIDNAVFGTNSLSKANSIATTFVFGNNNLQNIRKSRINTILGHNNFKNASNIVDRIVAVGQDIAQNSLNLRSSVILGCYALQSFKGNFYDINIWNELIAIGTGAGINVEEAQKSIFIGEATGNSKNVFQSVVIGNRSGFKDKNTSTNEIVIGAATTGNGNNTATIGNSNINSVHLSNIAKIDRRTGISGINVFPANSDTDFVQRKHLQEVKPYKIYSGSLVFDESTAQPKFTVFENTVGDIVWSKKGTGEFIGTLNGAFPSGKIWSVSVINQKTVGKDQRFCLSGRIDNDTIYVDIVDSYGSNYDVYGEAGSFEFRVYN
ncbi:hypothetical protein [Chryseobacterium mucoviscidosis]|uniref:Uncharacterized protein n=1 Tax=Chryseobacterium mucoviscidosis TaxID=1945581 RepID=A0A202BW47_9FLAO|nr:hypothetical protein [Chryseobacterium mucoviscidosis]OVE55595.1 hypothetical protein B0E34_15330 [Chryseobacterium mucoviscidosis]